MQNVYGEWGHLWTLSAHICSMVYFVKIRLVQTLWASLKFLVWKMFVSPVPCPRQSLTLSANNWHLGSHCFDIRLSSAFNILFEIWRGSKYKSSGVWYLINPSLGITKTLRNTWETLIHSYFHCWNIFDCYVVVNLVSECLTELCSWLHLLNLPHLICTDDNTVWQFG